MPRRRTLPCLLACLVLVAACGPAPATQRVAPLALEAATPPPATRAPRATTTPSRAPSATATPAPSSTPVATPPAPRVGIQVGHWQLKDLPEELANIRGDSGAYYRGYDEWEVNVEIARYLQRRLEAAGVIVDLLPATIPVAYGADAFVSVHCDGADGALAAKRRGWKAATPFRASPAAQALLAAVEESYGRVTGLPADTRGASLEMRAYYAFAPYRYQHTIALTTPAIIVETGFMTHPDDRALLFDAPDRVAQGIAEGLLAFLSARGPDTAPPSLPTLRVEADTALFERPSRAAGLVRHLGRNEALVTLSATDGWFLVTTRAGWDIGWVSAQDAKT